MLRKALFATALICGAPLAHAQDAANGEQLFSRCTTCHMITSPDGENIAGRGQQGPNLWGVVGRQAGTYEGFDKYGDSLVAAGEAGLVWTEEELTAYVANPMDYLRTKLDDRRARSMMSFRLPNGGEDVAAYLAQFGPEG